MHNNVQMVIFRHLRNAFGYVCDVENVMYGSLGVTLILRNLRYTTDWYDLAYIGMTGLTKGRIHLGMSVDIAKSSSADELWLSAVLRVGTSHVLSAYVEAIKWSDRRGKIQQAVTQQISYPGGPKKTPGPLVMRVPNPGSAFINLFYMEDKEQWLRKVALMTHCPKWEQAISTTKQIFPT